jgi:MOSC domain-containing protein YiiM
MTMHVRTILAGMPGMIHDGRGDPDPWYSGFAKTPLSGTVAVGRENIAGDGQADRTVHGGPEKAILGYCGDHYPLWCSELGRNDLRDGAFGENFAFTGLDEQTAAIGDRYRVGTALIEVSQPRQPCWKLARRCGLPTMPALSIATGRLGWYFRVVEPGNCTAGCAVELRERPNPAWTIARINTLFFGPLAIGRAALQIALNLSAMSPEFAIVYHKRFGN